MTAVAGIVVSEGTVESIGVRIAVGSVGVFVVT